MSGVLKRLAKVFLPRKRSAQVRAHPVQEEEFNSCPFCGSPPPPDALLEPDGDGADRLFFVACCDTMRSAIMGISEANKSIYQKTAP